MTSSTSNDIAKGLKRKFKQTVFCKTGECLKADPKHFLEGMVVERTPYKETYYIWSIIAPTWIDAVSMRLTYGARMGKGRYFEGSSEKIIMAIMEELERDETAMRRLEGDETAPGTFLETCFQCFSREARYVDLSNIRRIFDYGVASVLCEDFPASVAHLSAFMSMAQRSQHYMRMCARDILASIQADDGQFLSIIADMESQGKARLPFGVCTSKQSAPG